MVHVLQFPGGRAAALCCCGVPLGPVHAAALRAFVALVSWVPAALRPHGQHPLHPYFDLLVPFLACAHLQLTHPSRILSMWRLTQPFQTLQVSRRLARLLLLLLLAFCCASAARLSSTWCMTSEGRCSQSRGSRGFCRMLCAAWNRRINAWGSRAAWSIAQQQRGGICGLALLSSQGRRRRSTKVLYTLYSTI